MRSKNADKFNHDDQADGYDEDVKDESQPLREGYAQLLKWVADQSNATHPSRVLELGVGTGNLATQLQFEEFVGVDISKNMILKAGEKLGDKNAEFYKEDVLHFFKHYEEEGEDEKFDAIVSTYALHHLDSEEKKNLFKQIANWIQPGGRLVIGDLMFENQSSQDAKLNQLRSSGQSKFADDIEDEFFWNIEAESSALEALGFSVETKQVSEFSWGILARFS